MFTLAHPQLSSAILSSERRTTKDRNLAAGLQRTTSAQFAELLAAGRVCTDRGGDEGTRKASTALLEPGTQTLSPAPDLIPAETSTENLHWDCYIKRGHFSDYSAMLNKVEGIQLGSDTTQTTSER
jgi:hypothetical protein